MKHFYLFISMRKGEKGLSEILILPISRGKRRKNENMRIFVISLWWYVSTRLLKSIIIFCKTSF